MFLYFCKAKGIFVSWRWLGTESYTTKYNIYRDDEKINAFPLNVTNFTDTDGSVESTYQVAAVVDSEEQEKCDAVTSWESNKLDIELDIPEAVWRDGTPKLNDDGSQVFCMEGIYSQRIAESGKPMWALEYRSSNGNGYTISGPKGFLRSLGMLSLLQRTQMILGWTWRAMYAGEEKFIFGLLGHDGMPSHNFYEYNALAADMKKLEPYGFPYLPLPEIGVAYDYQSLWITEYNKDMFVKPYLTMQGDIAKTFYYKNMDYNTVDLRNLKNDYKLIIVPNQNIMNNESAKTIRSYVENGGTVIMTGTSAYMDENSRVFRESRPGRLADVFGIRVVSFNRNYDKWSFSDKTEKSKKNGQLREQLTVSKNGRKANLDAEYYEVLELNGAESFAEFEGKDMCAVSVNSYGKGKAYYTAAEMDINMLSWIIDEIAEETGLTKPLEVPCGVQARKIAEGQYFYVNHREETAEITLTEGGAGILSGKKYADKLILAPFDAELIVTE